MKIVSRGHNNGEEVSAEFSISENSKISLPWVTNSFLATTMFGIHKWVVQIALVPDTHDVIVNMQSHLHYVNKRFKSLKEQETKKESLKDIIFKIKHPQQ